MYQQIENDFLPQFAKTDLDFKTYYYEAKKISPYEEDIRKLLSSVLIEYANTKAKRKSGKIMRWLARVGSFVVKYLKIKK